MFFLCFELARGKLLLQKHLNYGLWVRVEIRTINRNLKNENLKNAD